MSERAKELANDALRWAGEAAKEWGESIKDSPEAHAYTLVLGVVLAVVARWFL